MKFNKPLLFSAFAAALAGILFGFDTSVIAGTTKSLQMCYGLTDSELGFTVSIALIGTVIGAIFASYPSDKWGRRDSLKITAFLFFLSAIWCALAYCWYDLLLARFIGGLAIGASSVIAPIYIAEIAPANLRGRLVALFQINIVLGFVFAFVSNYLIGKIGFDRATIEWRVMLGAELVPVLIFWTLLYYIPRSPRWLASIGKLDEAKQTLITIGESNPENSLKEIQDSLLQDKKYSKAALFTKAHKYPIFLAFMLAMFNQLSGVNVIWYYINDIFENAGFGREDSSMNAIYVSIANLICTIIAIAVIDKLGRKKMLLIGAVGTTLALLSIAYIYYSGENAKMLVYFVMMFICFFAFSQGAVIWVYLSEIFPSAVRAKGQSFGSFTHWGFNAATAWAFPVVVTMFAPYFPFIFYSIATIAQFLVVLFLFPETKGISLESLQRKLISKH